MIRGSSSYTDREKFKAGRLGWLNKDSEIEPEMEQARSQETAEQREVSRLAQQRE